MNTRSCEKRKGEHSARRGLECGGLPPLCGMARLAACGGSGCLVSVNSLSARSKLRPPQSGAKAPHSRLLPAFQSVLFCSFLALVAAASAAIKQEIPDLKPPREEVSPEYEASTALPWMIVGGMAAALVVFFAWPRQPKRVVVESPAEIARRELRGVTAPLAVSRVLRRYLLAAFPLPGEGASTEEISECLFTHIPSDPTLAHQVTEFLLACDTEKFAPTGGARPELAVVAAGWAAKTGEGTPAATAAPTSAAEVALSLIDKMEKRRHRTAREREL